LLVNPFIRQNLRSYVSMPNEADLQSLADQLGAGTLRAPLDRTFPLRDGKATGKVVLTV
jgi:NADPH:quinone reductase-like Zn-dependent oxidoreductase